MTSFGTDGGCSSLDILRGELESDGATSGPGWQSQIPELRLVGRAEEGWQASGRGPTAERFSMAAVHVPYLEKAGGRHLPRQILPHERIGDFYINAPPPLSGVPRDDGAVAVVRSVVSNCSSNAATKVERKTGYSNLPMTSGRVKANKSFQVSCRRNRPSFRLHLNTLLPIHAACE